MGHSNVLQKATTVLLVGQFCASDGPLQCCYRAIFLCLSLFLLCHRFYGVCGILA